MVNVTKRKEKKHENILLFISFHLILLYVRNVFRFSMAIFLSPNCKRKFFKGCLPQILLGPFLNTLSHMWLICKSYRLRNRKTFQAQLIVLSNSIEASFQWHYIPAEKNITLNYKIWLTAFEHTLLKDKQLNVHFLMAWARKIQKS